MPTAARTDLRIGALSARPGAEVILPIELVTSATLVLGKRGSGKTNGATVLVEEVADAGAPFVVLDPIDAWWGLKSNFAGDGPGLEVIIFGGPHADVPIEPEGGALMADWLVENRLPAIISMKGWSGAKRAHFTTEFAERLLDVNREPLLVVLEEADAYIPQKPYKGEERMLGAMDRLVRWGRMSGLGALVISQRSAKINKDVTTQADVLVSFKVTGPQDRDAADDWIKFHATGDERTEMLSTLPSLAPGESWLWAPDQDLLARVQWRRRWTFDSAATPKVGTKRVEPKKLADVDLDAVRAQFAEVIERAEADDPRTLRRRIADLERQVTAGGASAEQLAAAVADRDEARARAASAEQRVSAAVDAARIALSAVSETVSELTTTRENVAELLRIATSDGFANLVQRPDSEPKIRQTSGANAPRTGANASPRGETVSSPVQMQGKPAIAPRSNGAAVVTDGEVQLKAGARKMVETIARAHPMRLSKPQIATLAGFKVTGGTFGTYWGHIKRAGLIEEDADGLFTATQAGLDYVGVVASTPLDPAETREMWRSRLKAGARKMLDVLVEAHPRGYTRADLADVAGFEASGGTFGTYLGHLRRNGLAHEVDGVIVADDGLVG